MDRCWGQDEYPLLKGVSEGEDEDGGRIAVGDVLLYAEVVRDTPGGSSTRTPQQ